MGLEEIRKLKAAKKGSVMTAKELNAFCKIMKVEFYANPMHGKFHSGHYDTSKGPVYFRSKWEAQYAQYLDWLIKAKEIKDWQYEPETFFFDGIKMGTNCYKPDFKVWTKTGAIEYHEVKGYMDAKSKTKLKRMKKYHPEVKVVLIERKQLDEIKRNLKGLINFYK